MGAFTRGWWAAVLFLAPVAGIAGYYRWAHPHPYPALIITCATAAFLVVSVAAGAFERRRAARRPR
ncbi:MAG TPA: hypothetical protein VHK88_02870 [Aquihabitans sp.]|jgi:peptidoglycan/LPS O-acetylase OafA/YrhL|nr:hypothetical protein [Aquihabitans sp.]